MKIVEADQNRYLQIPGLPGPTRRPVDIDISTTGFANLRSLRIYRFDAGAEINGHAEEDEVFVLVLAGSVEFTASHDGSAEGPRTFQLSAASTSTDEACLAYLPPHAAYRLVPKTDADVAYARATPSGGPFASVFVPRESTVSPGITVLLEETQYARKLRIRLVRVTAADEAVAFRPIAEEESHLEALIHVRLEKGEQTAQVMNASKTTNLSSWTTVVHYPGTPPSIRIPARSTAQFATVLAR